MKQNYNDIKNYYIHSLLVVSSYKKLEKGDKVNNTWIVLDIKKHIDANYEAYAFQHQGSMDIVIVHKEESINCSNDYKSGFLKKNKKINMEQIKQALEFNNDICDITKKKYAQITHTGHYLGAYIAKIVCSIQDGSAVSFNGIKLSKIINLLSQEFTFLNKKTINERIINIDLDEYLKTNIGKRIIGRSYSIKENAHLVNYKKSLFILVILPFIKLSKLLYKKTYRVYEFNSMKKIHHYLENL